MGALKDTLLDTLDSLESLDLTGIEWEGYIAHTSAPIFDFLIYHHGDLSTRGTLRLEAKDGRVMWKLVYENQPEPMSGDVPRWSEIDFKRKLSKTSGLWEHMRLFKTPKPLDLSMSKSGRQWVVDINDAGWFYEDMGENTEACGHSIYQADSSGNLHGVLGGIPLRAFVLEPKTVVLALADKYSDGGSW